jgi:hypothetical protein
MKRTIFIALFLMCSHGAAAQLDKKLADDAKEFLKKYLQYNNTGNIELANLYSPEAEITLSINKQYGQTKQTKLNGQTWAKLLRDALGGGQATAELLEFHNVSVSGNGENLEITAQRYSTSRCYFDNDYKIVITKDARPAYRIIKETIYINHNNLCQPADNGGFSVNQHIQLNQP